MDNSQILRQLEELKQQVAALKEKIFDNEVTESKRDYSIKLDAGKYFSTGSAALAGYTNQGGDLSSHQAVLFVGEDTNPDRGGVDNTQLTLLRDNTNNQSYLFSISGVILNAADGFAKSGSTILTAKSIRGLASENLINQLITVRCDNGLYYGFYITANSGNTITLSSALPDAMSGNEFLIYNPVFLGSPLAPWERLYVTSGTAGGVRFGEGTTTGGQNGLLYMNSSGNLFWRTPAGASTQLN